MKPQHASSNALAAATPGANTTEKYENSPFPALLLARSSENAPQHLFKSAVISEFPTTVGEYTMKSQV